MGIMLFQARWSRLATLSRRCNSDRVGFGPVVSRFAFRLTMLNVKLVIIGASGVGKVSYFMLILSLAS
jgi:hypothetical protein